MENNSPWKGFGTSLAQGAAQAGVNAGVNGLFGLIGQALQNRQQRKLMAEQQKYQRENFEMQSQYNNWFALNGSRLSKDGLRMAGLSPAAMNGNGFSPATATINPASVSTTGANNPFGNINFDVNQGMLTQAQIRNINADTENKLANTEWQNIVNRYEPQLRAAQIDKTEFESILLEVQSRATEEGIDLTKAQVAETALRSAYIDKQVQWYDELTDAQIRELDSRAHLNESNMRYIDQQIPWIGALLRAQIYETTARGKKAYSDIEVNDELIAKMVHEVRNLDKEGLILSKQDMLLAFDISKRRQLQPREIEVTKMEFNDREYRASRYGQGGKLANYNYTMDRLWELAPTIVSLTGQLGAAQITANGMRGIGSKMRLPQSNVPAYTVSQGRFSSRTNNYGYDAATGSWYGQ